MGEPIGKNPFDAKNSSEAPRVKALNLTKRVLACLRETVEYQSTPTVERAEGLLPYGADYCAGRQFELTRDGRIITAYVECDLTRYFDSEDISSLDGVSMIIISNKDKSNSLVFEVDYGTIDYFEDDDIDDHPNTPLVFQKAGEFASVIETG